MFELLNSDMSKEIRQKLMENGRELIETNFSEYIPELKDRTTLETTDEFGNSWIITKTNPRCFNVIVKGNVWKSTFECTYDVVEYQLPNITKVKLTTKQRKIT